MTQGGIIIRLIDIALIILFGFIAISDVNVKAQIKLPTPIKQKAKESRNLFLIVEVKNEGVFELVEDKERYRLETLEELELKLVELRNKYSDEKFSLYVLIKPEEESIVQLTVSVMDLCTRLELPKNIAYNYDDLNF